MGVQNIRLDLLCHLAQAARQAIHRGNLIQDMKPGGDALRDGSAIEMPGSHVLFQSGAIFLPIFLLCAREVKGFPPDVALSFRIERVRNV